MIDSRQKRCYTVINYGKEGIVVKKFTVHSETVYLLALILLSASVATLAAADFGVSMIVAPAYILCRKLTFLTFGQCEYILQGILFAVFCVLMKKVKPVYFSSFLTGVIYGLFLDAWRMAVPLFDPNVTEPGSMSLPVRIVLFAAGMVGTSLSIALFYKTYLYPQVYDFFVKGIAARFSLKRTKFKRIFDAVFLLISCAMTLLFFGTFVGVGVGTLVITVMNGILIGLFEKGIDRCFTIVPYWEKFSTHFAI